MLHQLTTRRQEYYARTNSLIQQYIYIDKLLDSSLPHDLLNEYNSTPGPTSPSRDVEVPPTISEEPPRTPNSEGEQSLPAGINGNNKKVKRTPRELYKVVVPNETTALIQREDYDSREGFKPDIPWLQEESVESGDQIVQLAIYVNLAANTILLAGKIVVMLLTNSLSVLASLVDAALDFLSTAIVWTTTRMIERQDQYQYPVGRRRLEPIGVLVFSVVMMVSFFQVALECLSRLNSGDHSIVELGLPAIIIMSTTILIKAACWFWCRLVKNSSVQALAQDAQTDVIFNIFSIIFPIGMLFTCPPMSTSTHIYHSWILCQIMVDGCSWWSPTLHVCNFQLGDNLSWTYSKPHRSCGNRGRKECSALPYNALRQNH